MSSYGLMHKTVSYKIGNRKDLLEALRCLSDGDCDFNGENGLDYVCEDAKAGRFNSNQDYYLSIAEEISDEEDAINTFLDGWLKHDNYYDEWNVEFETAGKTKFISLAALTYC